MRFATTKTPPVGAGTQPALVAKAGAGLRAAGPGLVVCLVVAVLGWFVNSHFLVLSPLLVAIVVGIGMGNAITLPDSWSPGIAVASRPLLRAGIILLGLQLSLQDILALGPRVIGLAVAVVVLGVLGGLALGAVLGIPMGQRVLIACGFSICGAAAVAAADSVINAEEEETAAAIGLVVLFGTISIPLVPFLGGLAGLDDHWRSVAIGASVHEVAQVVASAGLVGTSALATAVVVKLARVVLLAPVMAGVSVWHRRRTNSQAGRRPAIVPLFVVGFLACVLIRSFAAPAPEVLALGRTAQTVLLSMAMFALGLGVRRSAMRRVGLRPIVLGALVTALVYGIALGGAAASS